MTTTKTQTVHRELQINIRLEFEPYACNMAGGYMAHDADRCDGAPDGYNAYGEGATPYAAALALLERLHEDEQIEPDTYEITK